MKIIVFGAGSIGSLYGGLLAHSGEEVHLVGRPHHMNAIAKYGLKIISEDTEIVSHPIPHTSVSEIDDADLILLTTKAYSIYEALKSLEPLAHVPIVVLQNGLGNEDIVSEVLKSKMVFRAITCNGAMLSGPGKVIWTGKGNTEIGSNFPEMNDLGLKIVEVFRNAGFEMKWSDNVQGTVWLKAIANAAINPISGLTHLRNGELYSDKSIRHLMLDVIKESLSIVRAARIDLPTNEPIRYVLGTLKRTGNNKSSMLQDIEAGKPTEIDFINGAIANIAEKFGMSAPINKMLTILIKAKERSYLPPRDDIVDFIRTQQIASKEGY